MDKTIKLTNAERVILKALPASTEKLLLLLYGYNAGSDTALYTHLYRMRCKGVAVKRSGYGGRGKRQQATYYV